MIRQVFQFLLFYRKFRTRFAIPLLLSDDKELFSIKGLNLSPDNMEKLQIALEELSREGPRRKRVKIQTDCPSASSFGVPSNWLQNSGIVMPCCHLKNSNSAKAHSLHVSLIVEAFGKFLDAMKSENIPSRFLKFAKCMLMATSGVHFSEDEYAEQLFPIWRQILSDLNVTFGSAHSNEVDRRRNVRTDSLISFKETCIGNIELKKDMAGITSNPTLQSIGYHVKLQKNVEGAAPILSIIMVGFNMIQVYGVAWNCDEVCIDPLSQPVSLMFVPKDPLRTIRQLAVLLHAVHVTLQELKTFVECPRTRPYFMVKHSLSRIQKVQSFEMCYQAMRGDSRVFVKFSRTYGKPVHELLAQKNLAPQLIVHEQLAGGWHGVIMEYIEGTKLSCDLRKETRDSLKKAVSLLHDNGYVHGDLRPPEHIAQRLTTLFIGL